MTEAKFADTDTPTLTEMANAYDVDAETIVTLVNQLADIDGEDMVIAEDSGEVVTTASGMQVINLRLTPDAVEALHEHITGTSSGAGTAADVDLLYEVEAAAEAVDQARDEAMARRDAAVRAAVEGGHKKTEIARRAGIHRQRLYQILNK